MRSRTFLFLCVGGYTLRISRLKQFKRSRNLLAVLSDGSLIVLDRIWRTVNNDDTYDGWGRVKQYFLKFKRFTRIGFNIPLGLGV